MAKKESVIKVTYQIDEWAGGLRSITCLVCHKISYNENDIKYLYCANCRKYHRRIEEEKKAGDG